MRRLMRAAAAAIAVVALSDPSIAIASTSMSSSKQQPGINLQAESTGQAVWIAQDVTQAFHFTLQYTHYSKDGNVIGEETVTPPAASLVEYRQIPLSQALIAHEDYIVAHAGESSQELSQELETLHQKLYTKLNGLNAGQSASSSASPSVDSSTGLNSEQSSGQSTGPNTSMLPQSVSPTSMSPMSAPSGEQTDTLATFTDYHGVTWQYDITYNTYTVNQINVTGYEIYEERGTTASYFNHLNWNGQNSYPWSPGTLIPRSYPGLDTLNLNWSNPPGNAFTTVVTEGNVSYSSYATLS